jgi:hypothetical protein
LSSIASLVEISIYIKLESLRIRERSAGNDGAGRGEAPNIGWRDAQQRPQMVRVKRLQFEEAASLPPAGLAP